MKILVLTWKTKNNIIDDEIRNKDNASTTSNGHSIDEENNNQQGLSVEQAILNKPKRVGTGTGAHSQEKINSLHEGINNTHHHQQTQRHKMNL